VRILVTGADGFVGCHLVDYLLQDVRAEVLGLGLRPCEPGAPWMQGDYRVCDVRDGDLLRRLVLEFQPEYVFHLAAQSSVKQSWEHWELTYDIALRGQRNLLEALREAGGEARVHVACSSEEYGKVAEEELPLREDHPLRPATPYAFSKVIQDYLAVFYFQAYGVKTVRTRAFNQTGPGQAPEFVVSDFAHQIALIEAGRSEPVMRVGNLEARRDFSDVRDLAAAYWHLLERGEPGEAYNVCSGRALSVRELLDMLLSLAKRPIEIMKDPSRMRPLDVPVLVGDNTRMRAVTGWEPAIPIERTLADVLDYWRAKV
jgi:GDP-4-dehydro-6-deoxy-D-mannose reductase